ncbi:MAG: manganese efflux pump [Eubacterium sp.]|nr:manganese efflux pump [Eubacterium sp.]
MIRFLIQSVLLGVGLAMDAFSVSIVNGLREPHMRRRKQVLIAGTFAFFQFFMPVIGWFCVRSITAEFRAFQHLVPWIALLLLLYIGGKMLLEGVRAARLTPEERREALEEEAAVPRLGKHTLLLQGIATSIDALSVGFAIVGYSAARALCCALLIAAVTYVICAGGLRFGRQFGERLQDKANLLGGIVLIGIGLEIWIRGMLGIG